MASSNHGNVDCEETVFTEIMDIICALNKSGKLKAKYKDVVKYLSSCDESWEDFSKLPHEFKMISLMSKDPNTLCEFLDTKFSQKTELASKKIILDKPVEIGKSSLSKLTVEKLKLKLELLYLSEKPPFPQFIDDLAPSQQISNDALITKVLTITKEWIFNGTFDDIGEKQQCHRAIVVYLTELKNDELEPTVHSSLDKLFLLIESGDIEKLINELREILKNLQTCRPELFEENFSDIDVVTKKVLNITNELVLQGSFEDLGDNLQCMLAVSKYLTLGTNGIDQSSHVETCNKIISLKDSCQTAELKDEVRNIITFIQSGKFVSSTASVKYSKEEYEEVVKKVIKIVNDSIALGAYDDIYESKTECHLSALSYLSLKEQDFNQDYVLPREHEDILMLHEKGDLEGLVRYLRKLLINGKETYAVERIELRVEKATKELDLNPDDEANTKTSRNIESIVALLGTTFTTGLTTLHVLAPIAQTFRSLIENINLALLNPALSSWPVLSGVTAAFGAGILVWNANCVVNRKKSMRLALKDSVDALGPMAVASAVGGLAALALASIAPPIWISLLAFGGLGIVTHVIFRPLIKRFSRWLFFEIPEHQAKRKAYATLEVDSNVTDEELRKAYRSQSRKFHPDMKARSGSDEDCSEKLLEVQQAYEYLVSIRLRDMGKASGPGFLARLRKFMSDLWKKNADEEEWVVLAIENGNVFDEKDKKI